MLVLLSLALPAAAQNIVPGENTPLPDSTFARLGKPRPWLNAAENIGINAAIYSVDRWILKRDYCINSLREIRQNVKKGFRFDGDLFETNFVGHPYHGALYYTAARSNNLSLAAAAASTLAGSLAWEEVAETDDPSINDIFSTVVGGIAVGEVLTRLARLPLNDSLRGASRFGRELLAAAISPMQGVNRLLRGDAWRVRDKEYLYHDREALPYDLRIETGFSHFRGHTAHGSNEPYLSIKTEYGDETEGSSKPYDDFTMALTVTLPHKRPVVNHLSINGGLIGRTLSEKRHTRTSLSIRQDFTYYNYEKNPFITTSRTPLLRLTETAAIGIGAALHTGTEWKLQQQLQAHAVMMGGYTSDYNARDYNMGSGYNAKSITRLAWKDRLSLSLHIGYHYLFVWKGYEQHQLRQNPQLQEFNLSPSREAGEKGHCHFLIVQPSLDLRLSDRVHLVSSLEYFTRHSVYRYQENVSSYYYDLKLGLSYSL